MSLQQELSPGLPLNRPLPSISILSQPPDYRSNWDSQTEVSRNADFPRVQDPHFVPRSPHSVVYEAEVKLLKLIFGDRSVVTRSLADYKEMEKAARRALPIRPDATVRFSAVIASLGDGKLELDATIWPDIRNDLTEMWVEEDWDPKRRRMITLSHRLKVHSTFEVEADGGLTVQDLKEHVLRNSGVVGRVRIHSSAWKFWDQRELWNDVLVSESSYSYSFGET